ncbi:sugar phosphate isomerase/epimerase family protein [Mangrovibacterium sp.]|uniref:sugar phosphate isomerase/epimerase family protein n=1 Tax=Mangrovibacterium sp. TaxID=1961364 RepID=UPI003561F4AB
MKNRRSFIKDVSLLSASLMMLSSKGLIGAVLDDELKNTLDRKIYIFSKHLQWLDYSEMAKTAREIGFDGVDLTVRPKGHVLPERVAEDLPKAVKAVRENGLLADRMTTAITDPDDELTVQILKTAADQGITNYRLGWLSYDWSIPVNENIRIFNEKLRKLAALNKQFGLKGAYQNHAGEMAGGPVWDIALMLEGVDPDYLGVRYDIRHATAEGGQSWPIGLNYLADKINSFDLKDFRWENINGKWSPVTVPLGEGMVDFARFFQIIHQQHIAGDITMHFEYELGGAENGTTHLTKPAAEVIAAMKQDISIVRNWLKQN